MKDTVVSGSLRATDTIYSTTAQFQILRAPISSGGTTYGPGTNGNFLKSNGTSAYWTSLAAADIPTISIADKTSGTLAVTRGGTGSTTVTGARSNLGLGNAKIFYGICSTAAGTVAKEVECADFSAEELKSGAAILVTFTNTNSGAVASLTMDVNGTGAKALKKQYNSGATENITAVGVLQAGNTYLFVYNASYNSGAGAWVLMTADYNNTYDLSQVSSASGASRQMETAANGGLGSHRYTLEMMTLNQKWSAISAVSGSTDANQETAVAKVASTANFLLNSPILYTDTNLYTAPGGSNNLNGYTAATMNLRYSIGTTASNVSLTCQKPVYLVGIVNSDDVTFKLDATKWWTQDLPTTNDGKIYIFLGMAYTSASIYLHTNHPIYYHNGTTVKAYNPGIHFQDETLLTNDGNEYVTVTSSNPVYIQNAEARDAENVIIEIEPKQDLHGYDNPWPEGGNKNIMQQTIDNIKAANTNGTWNGNAYTYKDVVFTLLIDSDSNVIGVNANGTASANADFIIKAPDENYLTVGSEYTLSGCPANGSSDTYYQFLRFYSDDGSSSGEGGRDTGSSTGKQLTVTSGYSRYRVYIRITSGVTCNNLVFHPMLELGSTATSYVPYSNICPIAGWEGCEVKDEGKNLLQTTVNFPITIAGVTWNIRGDGAIIAQRTASSSSNSDLSYISDFNSPKLISERYIFSCFDSESTPSGSTYQANIKIDGTSHWGAGIYRFTASDSTIIEVVLRVYPSFNGTAIFKPMLELGSTQSNYEPYKSQTIPITLPSSAGTVYGGTIDLATGKCVITKKIYNAADLAGWRLASASSSETHKVWRIDDSAFSGEISKAASWGICSKYKPAFGIVPTYMPESSFNTNTSGILYVCDSRFSTLDEFQASYGDCQLVLELATPLEYDIAAPQIPLFNGINNLQLDCGEISFNYHTNIYPVSLDKSGNMAVQVPIENNNFHLQNNEYLTANGNEYVSVSEVSEISIPDAAASNIKNAVISIKPSQDLNGYDSPWAPGANKNMLDATFDSGTDNGITYIVTKTSDGYVKSVTINGTVGSTNSRWGGQVHLKAGTYILSGCPAGGADKTYNMTIRNGGLSASVIGNVDMGDGATITLANNGTYYLTIVVNANLTVNNLTFYPMLRLSSITDSTFVPYSNICPIGGWTGATVKTEGKNLADPSKVLNGYILDDGNFQQNDYYRTVVIDDLEPGTYTFSVAMDSTAYIPRILFDGIVSYVAYTGNVFTFTTTKNGIVKITFRNTTTTEIGAVKIQLECSSTATDYEPYKSRIFPISFPSTAGTVYGGTIDLERGKLVVDRAMVDLGTLTWNTDGTRFNAFLGGMSTANKRDKGICSVYSVVNMSVADAPDKSFIFSNTGAYIYIKDTSYTDAATFKTAMSGVQLIYELAAPLEYDISIPPITLFNGLNNLWLNCGTMSFDYQTNVYPVSLDKSGNLAVQVSLDNNESNYILSSNVRPTIYKKYESTSFYGTSNNSATCTFFFMSVRPDEWYKPWRVRFKVHSYCPAYPNNHSVTYCTLSGRLSSSIYSNWNELVNSAHNYIGVMMLNEAGYNNGLGHAVGIDLRNSGYYNNSAYYRTFEVEYYDCDGCTVSFLDEPVLQANWPNYNTTNYGAINEYNAIDRGLQESGDANTHDYLELYGTSLVTSSTFRLGPYTLFGFDNNNRAQGISLYSTDYASSTVNINTARSYNTAGIDYTRGLYYFDNGTNRDKNINVSAILNDLARSAIDLRYTDNCIASSTANTLGMVQFKHVYLRGVIKEDGLFYLRPLSVTYNNATYPRAWTQDIPTSVETDGTYPYVYWLIGRPYYDSSYAASLYRVGLEMHNPVYWYHNGAFREYQKWPTYDIQYTSTTPTTRADGVSALQEGDIWFKPVS